MHHAKQLCQIYSSIPLFASNRSHKKTRSPKLLLLTGIFTKYQYLRSSFEFIANISRKSHLQHNLHMHTCNFLIDQCCLLSLFRALCNYFNSCLYIDTHQIHHLISISDKNDSSNFQLDNLPTSVTKILELIYVYLFIFIHSTLAILIVLIPKH